MERFKSLFIKRFRCFRENTILVDLALWALGNKKHDLDHIVLPVLRVVSLCLQYSSVPDKQELHHGHEGGGWLC